MATVVVVSAAAIIAAACAAAATAAVATTMVLWQPSTLGDGALGAKHADVDSWSRFEPGLIRIGIGIGIDIDICSRSWR